ncbi:hypothetical protein [Lysobacter solisilvae (ex Woo and Kim 2020)]|uniref:Uncharacterized protein n=1 Tax=Agrilutibacter terrestris TaxID=2865112 RepID=A0A7H0FWV9_9GAMM|nr:hypothetical protein [Lysobacter terrestris]QNP40525.1 hypothetical protein H8B22_13820 [Lysobacter terrestris]
MKDQIAIFRFTLSTHQSIGPAQLHALWARACETPHVSVGRARGASPDRPTYSLYASQRLENLPQVERRLRLLLEECKLRASLIPLHVT